MEVGEKLEGKESVAPKHDILLLFKQPFVQEL